MWGVVFDASSRPFYCFSIDYRPTFCHSLHSLYLVSTY